MLPFDTCAISTKQTFSYSQFVSFFGKLGTTLGGYDGVDFSIKESYGSYPSAAKHSPIPWCLCLPLDRKGILQTAATHRDIFA